LIRRAAVGAWIALALLAAVFIFLTASTSFWQWGLRILFPDLRDLLYPRADPAWLVGEHLLLVGSPASWPSPSASAWAWWSPARRPPVPPVAERLAAVVQTFPPAAVLALSVPALGFGFRPTIAALFLYSVLPIIRNTLGGLASVSADAVDAARGMGMTPAQCVQGRVAAGAAGDPRGRAHVGDRQRRDSDHWGHDRGRRPGGAHHLGARESESRLPGRGHDHRRTARPHDRHGIRGGRRQPSPGRARAFKRGSLTAKRVTLAEMLAPLPPPRVIPGARSTIRDAFVASRSKLVVLDDDPTGTQTVHGVRVFMDWSRTPCGRLSRAPSRCSSFPRTRGAYPARRP